jgi:hypothetical protein
VGTPLGQIKIELNVSVNEAIKDLRPARTPCLPRKLT